MLNKSCSSMICFCLFLSSCFTNADVMVFSTDENGGYSAFAAVTGNIPASINFDNIADDTDITGSTIGGVTFNALPNGAPLIVVDGNSTFTPGGFSGAPNPETNKLFPTSGTMVLSPGGLTLGPGANNAIENDDLELLLSGSVNAFGFDLLSQSADGNGATSIQVFNQHDALIYSGSIPISNLGGDGAPGGADFWGIITSNGDWISKVVIDEFDGNNLFPDSNVGYDSFRVATVPEPCFALPIIIGLATVVRLRKR